MTLELRHLRHFVAVAEELHFARAAARIGIEQSPLSRSIQDLEARLGVRLFRRTTRSTHLTYPGEIFLKEARRVLAAVSTMRRVARDAAAGVIGRVRVGAHERICPRRLASLLARCLSETPAIRIEPCGTSADRHISQLRDGEIDLCITQSQTEDDELTSVQLWSEATVVLLAESHPLATQKNIAIADVERLSIDAPSTALMAALAAVGTGVALVPESFNPPSGLGLLTRTLAGRARHATTWAAYRRNDDSAAIRRFLTVATAEASEPAPEDGLVSSTTLPLQRTTTRITSSL